MLVLVVAMDLEKTLPVEESPISGGALSDNLGDEKIVPADHPLVRLKVLRGLELTIPEMVVVKETLGSCPNRLARSHAWHHFDHPDPWRTRVSRRL